MIDETPYLLGQLLSLLITAGWADNHATVAVTNNLRGTMLPAIARAGGEGASQEIAVLVEQIGKIPERLSSEQQAGFWLGYYHRRRGPGQMMTAADMGKKGGAAKTDAKRAAAAENGKKGGRPRKTA